MRDLNTLEVMNDEAAKKAQEEKKEKVRAILEKIKTEAENLKFTTPINTYTRAYNQGIEELTEKLTEELEEVLTNGKL